jgi:FlaG/FlaF family flagellin (archaellin)
MNSSRSGISTMIASILLILIVVMTALAVHVYTMGYVGGFGIQRLFGAMVLDSVTVEPNTPKMIVMVRNIGETRLEISDAYINGVKTLNVTCSPYPIEQGKVGLVTITHTNSFVTGTTYSVKIVCHDNVQLMFDVKP